MVKATLRFMLPGEVCANAVPIQTLLIGLDTGGAE